MFFAWLMVLIPKRVVHMKNSLVKALRIFFLLFVEYEFESYAIVAISLAAVFFWPVVKNVALVAATPGAMIFRSWIKELPVRFCLNVPFDGLPKTRPARFAVIFCVGFKELEPAGSTHKETRAIFTVEGAAVSMFGAVVS